LQHDNVRVFGTPWGLAVLVRDVAEKSDDVTKEVTGPAVSAAFKDGKPTVAATRFAESVGLPVEKLSKVATPKGEKLGATVTEKGKRAQELLPELLSAAVHSMGFKKSMRWGDVDFAFARPVHWIVALFG